MNENLINEVKSGINYWYIPLVWGVLFLVAGIYTFFQPLESYVALAMIFGFVFLISGVSEIIMAFSTKSHNWILTLIFGVITTVLGFMLVSNLALSLELLPWYVGFIILFRSFSGISYYSELKARNISGAGSMLFSSILGIIIGLIMMISPTLGGLTIIIWTAIGFILCGIFGITLGIKLKD